MSPTRRRNGYEVRLRYGKGQRERFLLATLDAGLAAEIEPRMEAMARKLANAGDGPRAQKLLKEAAALAEDARKFAAVERVVDKICAEATAHPPAVASSALSTFRDVAEAWTSGDLHQQHGDDVPSKDERGRKEDRSILGLFYPALADLKVVEITAEDVDAAKRLLPPGIMYSTRQKYLKRLRGVFRISIDVLGLIERMPFRGKLVPKNRPGRLFWFLYPEEEAKLLGCAAIPLVFRLLYGFLCRNGSRLGETLKLTWDHVDLARGVVRLEASWTKTKRARFWKLEPDVLSALRQYHEREGRPSGEARVFRSSRTKKLARNTVEKRFLSDLRLAHVTDRPELFVDNEGARNLVVHDLRASFVTLALRGGRDIKWISDRSGHESLQVLKKYDRLVRHADELQLAPWFRPLDQAIPEFRTGAGQGGPSMGQRSDLTKDTAYFQRPLRTAEPGESQGKPAEIPPSVSPGSSLLPPFGPAENKWVGQTRPTQAEVLPGEGVSPVEQVLAAALQAAIGQQQWQLAQSIVMELGERRRARTAPDVPSISDARKRRDEKP